MPFRRLQSSPDLVDDQRNHADMLVAAGKSTLVINPVLKSSLLFSLVLNGGSSVHRKLSWVAEDHEDEGSVAQVPFGLEMQLYDSGGTYLGVKNAASGVPYGNGPSFHILYTNSIQRWTRVMVRS